MLYLLVFVTIVVALLCAVGLAAIWSVNTLFPSANIDYSFLNLFATLVLIAIFGGSGAGADSIKK